MTDTTTERAQHPLYTVSEAARRQLVRVAGWIEKEAYAASGSDDPQDEGLDEAARYLRATFDLSDEARFFGSTPAQPKSNGD